MVDRWSVADRHGGNPVADVRPVIRSLMNHHQPFCGNRTLCLPLQASLPESEQRGCTGFILGSGCRKRQTFDRIPRSKDADETTPMAAKTGNVYHLTRPAGHASGMENALLP